MYGPRQRPDGGVVAALHDAARSGGTPAIVADARWTRDLLYVDDAVDALVRAADRGGGLMVNVGTGEQTSVADLWAMLAPGRPVDAVATRSSGPDDLTRFAVSPVRARIHLQWSAWTTLEAGLARLDDAAG